MEFMKLKYDKMSVRAPKPMMLDGNPYRTTIGERRVGWFRRLLERLFRD